MPTTPDLKTVIGRGINFPVQFAHARNDQLLETNEGLKVINQSLYLIVTTQIGERINNPEFGSNVMSLVHEPNDQLLRDLLYFGLRSAIERWERRVTIMDIQFRSADDVAASSGSLSDYDQGLLQDPHRLDVAITYIVNETQQQGSFVFPFVRNVMPMDQVVRGREGFNFAAADLKG